MFGDQGGQLCAQGFVLGQGFAELEAENVPIDRIGWGFLDFFNGFRGGGGAALDLCLDPVPKGVGGKLGEHLPAGGSDGFEQFHRLIEEL